MSRATQQARADRAAAALHERERKERRRRLLVVVGILTLVAVVVAGGFLVQSLRDDTGEELSSAGVPSGTTDTYGVVVGDASAARTITVYEDFQCPACRAFEEQTADELAAAVDAGRVKVDYRMVSFLDATSTDEYSSRALNAAAVVLDTAGAEAFGAFHDLLFENQPPEGGPGLGDDELVDLAVEAGAEESEVREGIEDRTFGAWVRNTRDEMSKAGVTGTPTVLVDGSPVEGDPVDAVLAAAR